MLQSLVIDTENDHNTRETGARVARMYLQEIFAGRYELSPDLTAFPNVTSYDELYLVGPITIRSTCAHHLQNIRGNCWIGIYPGKNVLGLSKFYRLTEWITARPQIQEEMTIQVADLVEAETSAEGVAVVIKAEHMCVTHRGVREHASDMTTSVLRGKLRDNSDTRAEFFRLLQGMKGFAVDSVGVRANLVLRVGCGARARPCGLHASRRLPSAAVVALQGLGAAQAGGRLSHEARRLVPLASLQYLSWFSRRLGYLRRAAQQPARAAARTAPAPLSRTPWPRSAAQKDHEVALTDGQRAPELLLGQTAQDHADQHRRHRDVVAPHQKADDADDIQQRQVEPRVAQTVRAQGGEDEDARVEQRARDVRTA